MTYTVFYKLANDVKEYDMDIDALDSHEALRKAVDILKDLREVSVIEKGRKHGKGRGAHEVA